MRSVIVVIAVWLLAASVQAEHYRYSFGGGAGYVKLAGGDFFSWDWETAYTFRLGHHVGERYRIAVDYSFFTMKNRTAADSTGSVGAISNNTALEFQATRLGLTGHRLLFRPESPFNVSLGLGGGVLFWKMIDSEGNTTFRVPDSESGLTDFAATELFLSATTGLVISPVPRMCLSLDLRADYLTHAGADFDSEVRGTLERWILGAYASLEFRLGATPRPEAWPSDEAWTGKPSRQTADLLAARDSDGDGVGDTLDRCPGTRVGMPVGRNGCPRDSDNDGVPDGRDDCPGTSPQARRRVDVYGCAVDSDFDGLPDYADACPHSAVGAVVDVAGCPIDTDDDGVPDGLDDCPHTLPAVAIDRFGCIDLAMFSRPMVLNIDYPSGGWEIDPNSKERIRKLANTLNFVPEIRLEINGYTDNIGTATQNRRLSEKRAGRVRDFLVTLGIATERIKVFGRGEVNFVASNQTAEGRAANRRIEITFYR
jgi:OOP family OmpA-OmpF porin